MGFNVESLPVRKRPGVARTVHLVSHLVRESEKTGNQVKRLLQHSDHNFQLESLDTAISHAEKFLGYAKELRTAIADEAEEVKRAGGSPSDVGVPGGV